MKIVKISCVSGENYGDVMISKCINHLFETEKTLIIDSLDINTLQPFHETLNIEAEAPKSGAVQLLKDILFKSKKIKYFQRVSKLKKHFESHKLKLSGYDALIIGGGNMLFNKTGCGFLYFFDRCVDLFQDKKIIVYSVGVGPFDFDYKKQLANIIKRSSLFLVRDKKSYQLSLDTVKDDRIVLSNDPVFVLSDIVPLQVGVEPKSCFGVNVMRFNNAAEGVEKQNVSSIVLNLEKLAQQLNKSVKLVITSSEDIFINQEVYQGLLSKSVDVELIVVDKVDLAELYGSFDFFVSNRMHSSIFGLSYEVKTLFFGWQHKVRSMVEDVFGETDAPKVLLKDVNFDSEEIIAKVKDYPLESLRIGVGMAKTNVYQNHDKVVQILKKEKN